MKRYIQRAYSILCCFLLRRPTFKQHCMWALGVSVCLIVFWLRERGSEKKSTFCATAIECVLRRKSTAQRKKNLCGISAKQQNTQTQVNARSMSADPRQLVWSAHMTKFTWNFRMAMFWLRATQTHAYMYLVYISHFGYSVFNIYFHQDTKSLSSVVSLALPAFTRKHTKSTTKNNRKRKSKIHTYIYIYMRYMSHTTLPPEYLCAWLSCWLSSVAAASLELYAFCILFYSLQTNSFSPSNRFVSFSPHSFCMWMCSVHNCFSIFLWPLRISIWKRKRACLSTENDIKNEREGAYKCEQESERDKEVETHTYFFTFEPNDWSIIIEYSAMPIARIFVFVHPATRNPLRYSHTYTQTHKCYILFLPYACSFIPLARAHICEATKPFVHNSFILCVSSLLFSSCCCCCCCLCVCECEVWVRVAVLYRSGRRAHMGIDVIPWCSVENES